MCRLFGMNAGEEPLEATFWLLDASDSLSAQSHRNRDGTGIGWFGREGAPHVEKRPVAAFEDLRFATDAKHLRSRTFVAHIRHATNGARTAANTHPFYLGDRLFAHNGVIGDVPALERHLGDDLSLVKGQTDSERFFALITREIDGHDGDVEAGIRAAAGWVVANLPVVSINFVLVTASDVWALRYPDTNTMYVLERAAGGPGGDAPLHQRSRHGTRVQSEPARSRPLVIVASEQMDGDPAWREVVSGTLLHVPSSLEIETVTLFEGPPAHPGAAAPPSVAGGSATAGR